MDYKVSKKQNNGSSTIREHRSPEIITNTPKMLQILEMVTLIAEGDANVSIIGESGTGKELIARTIHAQSPRKHRAFVPVNCGALPENLFESELFGYEKGAFTGAYRRKPGLLEYADGGTFFLDEICELSAPLQVKLLRMLQDKKFRRVGGTELIEVDLRIISASNRDLEKAVSDGYLREDLFYRLNVISIQLPPLRFRLDDIRLLSDFFVQKYAKLTPKTISGISESAVKCLENYSWPGNVRELENAIERAITLAADEWIEMKDLPEKIMCPKRDLPSAEIDLPMKEAKAQIVAQFEQEYLSKMLIRHNGNVTRASQHSGIDRRTFHRLLNRHRIKASRWKENGKHHVE